MRDSIGPGIAGTWHRHRFHESFQPKLIATDGFPSVSEQQINPRSVAKIFFETKSQGLTDDPRSRVLVIPELRLLRVLVNSER